MEVVSLPPESQRRLLQLARYALEDFVRGHESPSEAVTDSHLCATQYGAFVSLHKGEELRGCIGTCYPSRPLFETIIDATQAAASRDHRVPPVNKDELKQIRIDISVLSPLAPLDDPLRIVIGRDGLHISWRERSGILLPQVATQLGWDAKTFLDQVCLKAGLPKHAWEWPGSKLSRFSALIIEEPR